MECQLENITIHYETFGEGKPIVMLHGWPADHLSCARFLEPIFKQRSGWQRIYPDLPGMGKTPGVDWITKQDDVLDVVLNFINDERERSLPQHITLVEDKALIEELEPDEAEMFQSMTVVQSQKTLDEFKDFLGRAIKMADQEYMSRLRNNFAFSFDVRVLSEPFDRPALILTGRQDSVLGYCDAWDILENYPRATFAVLDRAGHALPHEQEDLLHVLVDEWLDRV